MKHCNINNKSITSYVTKFEEFIEINNSKAATLMQIADYARDQLGEYFTPEILSAPNEITIHFIELLDQIVFELGENIPEDVNIREYIINDLYARISIFVQVLSDLQKYSSNIKSRLLLFEDTIIIKFFNGKTLLPLLKNEFYEQPSLQKWILRAMLSFDDPDLLHFYYTIIHEKNHVEVKILALLGLKKTTPLFSKWDSIYTIIEHDATLLRYIIEFEPAKILPEQMPTTPETIVFTLLYIEYNTNCISSNKVLVNLLYQAIEPLKDGRYTTIIYLTITNILLTTDLTELINTEHDEDVIFIKFLNILDYLPREYFDRISVKLQLAGNSFFEHARGLVNSGRILTKDYKSNLINYFVDQQINV